MPTPVPRVVGFTLNTTDSDGVIRRLRDGDTLTLADLPTPRLNVRADAWPAGVGSGLFGLDGVTRCRVESSAPFALAEDRAGNYEPWTPTAGPHTLEAVPYTGAGGTGTPGIRSALRFTVR